MSDEVFDVNDRILRHMTGLTGSLRIDRDGDITFRTGSAQLWISVRQVDEYRDYLPFMAVKVFANDKNRVPASPAQFDYVAAKECDSIGTLRCCRKDDGVRVFREDTLAGDCLDAAEPLLTISYIRQIENWVEDEIRKKFSGNPLHAWGE